MNINKSRAKNFNERVDHLHSDDNVYGIKAMNEAKDLDNLNKAVNKVKKLEEFKKMRQDDQEAILMDKREKKAKLL